MPDALGIAASAVRQAMPEFVPAATLIDGAALAMMPAIGREELTALLDRSESLTLVETLPAMFYRNGHLPGAINLPLESFDEDVPARLPDKATTIIVYCANLACKNSSIVTARLIELGYTNVRDYAGASRTGSTPGCQSNAERSSPHSSILPSSGGPTKVEASDLSLQQS